MRGRSRERVPLPRSGRRPRRPGRRRLAVGRDRRHAGRGQGGQGAAPRCSRSPTWSTRRSRALATARSTRTPGPEIGVASTKCFTTQLAALALLAIHLGRRTGTLDARRGAPSCSTSSRGIPHKMARRCEGLGDMTELARRYSDARDFLFLGRGTNYPIALEGALKLKEISYIHAEGYAAGEMKHGPIALIDEACRSSCSRRADRATRRCCRTCAEVRAREGRSSPSRPRATPRSASLRRRRALDPERAGGAAAAPDRAAAAAAELLRRAAKGTDVDQPRNLAKTVTVE